MKGIADTGFVSEICPRQVVVTIDEGDFRVYRRNKRENIPLLCLSRGREG